MSLLIPWKKVPEHECTWLRDSRDSPPGSNRAILGVWRSLQQLNSNVREAQVNKKPQLGYLNHVQKSATETQEQDFSLTTMQSHEKYKVMTMCSDTFWTDKLLSLWAIESLWTVATLIEFPGNEAVWVWVTEQESSTQAFILDLSEKR